MRRMERSSVGNVVFAVFTILLIGFIAFCIRGTVVGKSGITAAEEENYYREQECGMVREVRAYLNENGFRNSGVMLTRVTEADGSREYTLTVHHARIDAMEESEREILGEKLSAFDFAAEDCSFLYEFYE